MLKDDVRVDEQALRREMVNNGYYQILDLEKASGVPRSTIRNVLDGRHMPNYKTIQAIINALPASSVEALFSIFFTRSVT